MTPKWYLTLVLTLYFMALVIAAPLSRGYGSGPTQDDLDERMEAYRKALGVGCKHCHIVGEEEKWTRNKLVARYMQTEFVDKLSVTEKGEKKKLTCAYCHQGKSKIIDRTPPPKSEGNSYGPGAGAGPNANKMQRVMTMFAKGLGVSCSYCHEAMRWTADNGRKKTAKEMLKNFCANLVKADDKKLTCGTCHKGKTRFLPTEKDAEKKNSEKPEKEKKEEKEK